MKWPDQSARWVLFRFFALNRESSVASAERTFALVVLWEFKAPLRSQLRFFVAPPPGAFIFDKRIKNEAKNASGAS